MLTLVEAISLAGDRAKQNDDAYGLAGARAWVIDGATDLHDAPLTGWRSDASWVAQYANSQFHCTESHDLRLVISEVSAAAKTAFKNAAQGRAPERWQSPIASLLLVEETADGLAGIDLGDCRTFALGSDGMAHALGGPGDAGDDESQLAAKQTDAHKPLLERTETIDILRRQRARLNQPGGRWTFGLDPACAQHARSWTLSLARPAHILLCTDGFSALADRYRAYDAAGLVRAALEKGLQELGRELRAIETADSAAARHPRFKASDDATALFLRLD